MSKYLEFDDSGKRLKEIQAIGTSSGAGDASKIIQTAADGKIDPTFLPESDSINIEASESISANNLVNIFDDSGTQKIRNADNSNGRQADGYIKVSANNGDTVTIFRDGLVVGKTGLTVGDPVFLGTGGGITQDPTTIGSGNILHHVGCAESATTFAFEKGYIIERA